MLWSKQNQIGKNPSQALETTVTYLEMPENPHHIITRPANINAALLAARKMPLHFYRYVYFQVGMEWNWESRLRLNDKELALKIHDPSTEITVLYLDGAPAGFFEIYRGKREATDLAYFGMMRHAFGRGLGKWFLSAAIEACWSDNPHKVTVNTCTLDHPAALPLYQKMGFHPYRQAKGRVHPLSESELANLGAITGIIR